MILEKCETYSTLLEVEYDVVRIGVCGMIRCSIFELNGGVGKVKEAQVLGNLVAWNKPAKAACR